MQRQEEPGVQFGKYRVYAKLAVGGMAELFLARQGGGGNFHRTVVLKCVLPHLASDPDYLGMFRDEASIMATLNHSNIVQVYEFDEHNGVFYIAMEFIRGQHFKNFRKRLYRRLPDDLDNFSLAAGLIADVASGLHYAHTATDEMGQPLNLVHRDVSPTNLLLTYNGHVKIVDFGVAKAVVKDHHTTDGMIKGKYRYMSPEQIRGEPLDLRSDVFSLGTILYELSTNTGLFARASETEMIDAVRNAKIRRPSLFLPDYPAALEAIVMKSLHREPEQRYQSCAEMQMDLENFLRTEGHPYSVAERARLMQFFFGEEAQAEKTGVMHAPLSPSEMVRFLGTLPSSPPSSPPAEHISSPPSWNEAARLFDHKSHFPSSPPPPWAVSPEPAGSGALLEELDERHLVSETDPAEVRALVEEASARMTPAPMQAVTSSRPLVEDSGVAVSPPRPNSSFFQDSPGLFEETSQEELRRRRLMLLLIPVLLGVFGVLAAILFFSNRSNPRSPATVRKELREDILSELKQRQYVEASALLKKYQSLPREDGDKLWMLQIRQAIRLGPRLDLARQLLAQQKYNASVQVLEQLKKSAPGSRTIAGLLLRARSLQQKAKAAATPTPVRASDPVVAKRQTPPPARRQGRVQRPAKRVRRRRVVRRTVRRRPRRRRRLRVASAVRRRAPAMGYLTIRTTPSALVEMNGELLGTTPIVRRKMKPGQYQLQFRRQKYKSTRRQVTVRSGETTSLQVSLQSLRPVRRDPPKARTGKPTPAYAFSSARLKRKVTIRMFISDPRGIGGRHPTLQHQPVCRKIEKEIIRLLGSGFSARGVTKAWCRAVLRLSRKSNGDYRTLYPRAVAYVAYRNLSRGRRAGRVAQILVSYANSNRFRSVRGK